MHARRTRGSLGAVHTRTGITVVLAVLFALGCSRSTPVPAAPPADPWRQVSDAALTRELHAALARAKALDQDVLLDFVAPWCEDCREVVRVSHLEPARKVLSERYVTVYVNVGRFDRHRALMKEHAIDRIATLIVLDPDGHRVAKTTLEPISGHHPLSPEALAAWLRHPRDDRSKLRDARDPKAPLGAPGTHRPPLFPAEVPASRH